MGSLARSWTSRQIAALLVAGLCSYFVQMTPAFTQGATILQVSGKISQTDNRQTIPFDVASLEALGLNRIQTSTPWTEGEPVFEGFLVRDILEAVGAQGDTVVAIALNDYKVEIPISDFEKFPVLLAYKMDGQRLQVRDKGPLWIVYPQDEYPELKTKKVQSRWVWQLRELAVR